jgi:hypothetical protein
MIGNDVQWQVADNLQTACWGCEVTRHNRQDAASTPRTTWTCLLVWCGDPAFGP